MTKSVEITDPHLPIEHAVEIEVPFHDCDPMGIVWHGNYARYFEVARCALLDKIDYAYSTMFETGYAWPVIDMQLRYLQPCRFEQKLLVNVQVVEWRYRLRMLYTIRDAKTDQLLNQGSTTQVAMRTSDQSMCIGSPEVLAEKLSTYAHAIQS